MTHQDSKIRFVDILSEGIKIFFQIVGTVTKVSPQRKHGEGEHVLPENLGTFLLIQVIILVILR